MGRKDFAIITRLFSVPRPLKLMVLPLSLCLSFIRLYVIHSSINYSVNKLYHLFMHSFTLPITFLLQRKRANDSSFAQPQVLTLRTAEKPNQNYSDDAYDLQLKSQTSKAKHSLLKSTSDSRFPSQNGQETSSETSTIAEAVVSGKDLPAEDFLRQEEAGRYVEQSVNGLHNFQVDFIRNMIEDAIEDTRLVALLLSI